MWVGVSKTSANNEESAAAAPALSKLIATLTHELKTPLHSILSLADVLSTEIDGPLSAEQKRQVEMIRRNGRLLLEMITELLQYSSMSYRAQFLLREKVNLKQLVEEQLEILRSVAVQRRITLQAETDKISSDFVSDRTFLRQIVSNLVGNAVQYSPEGGTVSVYGAMNRSGDFELDIVDSGEGIPLHKQQEVFGALARGTDSPGRGENVGLGLAIVKASLEGLGGALEVKSEPGRGTLFRLRLPSAMQADRREAVVVYETEQAARTAIEQCLQGGGLESISASSLEELASLTAERDACAVVCSLALLPKGADLTQLRNRPDGGVRSIIVLAALDSPQERAAAKAAGASDFIAKPFDVDDFLARVLRSRH